MSIVQELAQIALDDPEPQPKQAATGLHAVVAGAADALVLEAAPIEPSWVLSGAPVARAKVHSTSEDGFASTTIWDCTAGAFRWNFVWDETVYILEGSVEVTDETGQTLMLSAGDVAFFAGGSWATWRVGSYVRKVAFCRRVFPRPVVAALSVKTWLRGLLRGAKPTAAGGLQPAVTAPGS